MIGYTRQRNWQWIPAALALLLTLMVQDLAASEQYTYDAAGRLTSVTFDDGTSIVYSYDRNGNIVSRSTSGTPPPPPVNATSGIYWDRARSGNGMDFRKSGNAYFMILYAYGNDNTPSWFLASGNLSGNIFSATAQRFAYQSGNTPPFAAIAGSGGPVTIDFNSAAVGAAPACNDSNNRSNAISVGVFDFSLDGQSGQWCVERFIVADGTPAKNFSGTWFNPDEPGWGMSISTQGSSNTTLVVVLYYYDANGGGRWVLGTGNNVNTGNSLTVPMSQFTGFCLSCTPTSVGEQSAGTLSLTLTQPSNTASAGNKSTVNVSFNGAPGGVWQRTNVPIQLLSDAP